MASELKPCGTVAAYRRHLRHGERPCDACREAENSRGRKPGGKPFQPAQHGTASKYNSGCRCEACTAAQRERHAAWRESVRGVATAVPELVPHGASGYGNYGCRCDTCKDAHSERCRDYYVRRRKTAAAS